MFWQLKTKTPRAIIWSWRSTNSIACLIARVFAMRRALLLCALLHRINREMCERGQAIIAELYGTVQSGPLIHICATDVVSSVGSSLALLRAPSIFFPSFNTSTTHHIYNEIVRQELSSALKTATKKEKNFLTWEGSNPDHERHQSPPGKRAQNA